MRDKSQIINQIKNSVKTIDPDVVIILYGSYARGDNREDSDIDLLLLLDQEEINRNDEKKFKYPLYDIEFNTGILISPIVISKKAWEQKHRVTPFYENIEKEGIIL